MMSELLKIQFIFGQPERIKVEKESTGTMLNIECKNYVCINIFKLTEEK